MAISLRLLKTDCVDLWQMHAIQNRDDIDTILGPGGAMEAFEAAKRAGKCRFIGFTGHYDPEALTALLKAYDKWDTVMMPIHAADHAYLSFEKTTLPVALERGVGTQAIKAFGKASEAARRPGVAERRTAVCTRCPRLSSGSRNARMLPGNGLGSGVPRPIQTK